MLKFEILNTFSFYKHKKFIVAKLEQQNLIFFIVLKDVKQNFDCNIVLVFECTLQRSKAGLTVVMLMFLQLV